MFIFTSFGGRFIPVFLIGALQPLVALDPLVSAALSISITVINFGQLSSGLLGASDPRRYVPEEAGRFMPKKGFIPNKLKPWIEARKKYRLSHAQVQMARQLGLNPKKFGGLANHKQEAWKMPLPEYIEHLYQKKFGKILSGVVKPLEVVDAEKRERKTNKKKLKDNNASGTST